jgi:sensor histidine kinase YesM
MHKSSLFFCFYFTVTSILILAQKCIAQAPKIEYKNIEVAGEEVEILDVIKTNYNQNNFQINISPLAEKFEGTKFYKRLGKKNFSKVEFSEWEEFYENKFKIINLETGKFLLEIKAINSSQETSNILHSQLEIDRPWWRTWWFWGASFVGLFGLFYSRERLLNQWEDEEKLHHRQIIELELKTLQLQMNPHFIFNALNSIQNYVLSHDALTANNYLSKFANLIRLFLDSSRSKYISLSEELRLLGFYCDMEQLRFENKFTFEITLNPKVDKYYELPTMVLQPFVENAINHGLRYKETIGILQIDFFNDDDYLICKITDNGVGRELAKTFQDKPKKGYKSQGLNITYERLETYNKINDSDIIFTIENLYSKEENKEQGTIVTVKFPLN